MILANKWFILIFIIIVVLPLAFLFDKKPSGSKVCFKDNCYAVELAKTDIERERGLMNRDHLDSGKGMFFVFDSDAIYPFWMKNTLIPLDMIWIDENGKVVYIYKNAQPCADKGVCQNIIPSVQARYVLEINAGQADRMGLGEGDELTLNSKLYE